MERVPLYWCELNPSAAVSAFFIFEGNPFTLATRSCLWAVSCTNAPGNQPTGIKPANRDSRSPGSNRTTAMAFWDPLAT